MTYQIIYDKVSKISLESFMGQEGGFTSLLYITKSLGISLGLFHCLEIVLFLYSISYLFECFVPKNKAIAISLIFGLQPVPGELAIYLLRQILSTSIMLFALGLFFRKKITWAWILAIFSSIFHSSSFFYLPFFLGGLFTKKLTKTLVIFLGYALIFLITYNFDFGRDLVLSTLGEDSLYAEKYEAYEQYAERENWRAFTAGFFSILMILYFVGINVLKKGLFWKSQLWFFYTFTVAITLFRLILERVGVFWLSSRFNFISSIFVLSSNILLTFEIIPEKEDQFFLALISILLFGVSVIIILSGFDRNMLFRIPS
ncbi:MAG: EpsG family protein [Snowella sp.]|nr:EpsG family protein [Snowella sp.]